MRKIFYLFCLCLGLGSCSEKVLVNTETIPYRISGDWSKIRATSFEYRSHEYIWFSRGGSSEGHIIHNPDCKYCKGNE